MSEHLTIATQAMAAGNLAAAEIACRDLLDIQPGDAAALHLLGVIAARVGALDQAADYLAQALAAEPGNPQIAASLAAARAAPRPQMPPGRRYLVIKSWGFGFWADMAQVMGSLLLAEATGRTPVTWWGSDSLFNDGASRDAFQLYFQSVSKVALADILPGARFFPPRWNAANITASDLGKWEGKGSRAGAPYFLGRPESVAVSDFYVGVVNVMPWLPANHPWKGKTLDELYRALWDKYLRPQPDIVAAADAFFDAHLKGAPFVAVHMRGSDKALEDPDLEATNAAFFQVLERLDPSWRIFLMTDDAQCLARMQAIYGDRLVFTDCQRSRTGEGVHYQSQTNPVQAGREVLIDALLALRADRFIGNGLSNVSAMIAVLKDWAADACTLIGRSQLSERNLRIYTIPTFAQPQKTGERTPPAEASLMKGLRDGGHFSFLGFAMLLSSLPPPPL